MAQTLLRNIFMKKELLINMDQELPKSELIEGAKALIQVTKSALPGVEACKAHVIGRSTIDVKGLARIAHERGSAYNEELLVATFTAMKEALYWAVRQGKDVDFGFGRTMLTPVGKFDSVHTEFDPELHSLEARLQPSPRLQQCAANRKVKNIHSEKSPADPFPALISTAITSKEANDAETHNRIPAGQPSQISIFGQRLRLMGDRPDVGLTLRCLDTGESYTISPRELIVNSVSRLCFTPKKPFTPGEWEATVVTQYSRTYRPTVVPRTATLTFTVEPQESSLMETNCQPTQ